MVLTETLKLTFRGKRVETFWGVGSDILILYKDKKKQKFPMASSSCMCLVR